MIGERDATTYHNASIEATGLTLDASMPSLLLLPLSTEANVIPFSSLQSTQVAPTLKSDQQMSDNLIYSTPAGPEPLTTITPAPIAPWDLSAAQPNAQSFCTLYSPCNIFFQVRQIMHNHCCAHSS